MDIWFTLYALAVAVVFFVLVLFVLRNLHIYDYRDECLTDGTEPLKHIPKKIFQLVPDKHNINALFQKNIDYIKKLNPDWTYTLYDDNDIISYIHNYYPELWPYYAKINPKYGAARADFFRYLLMYREGGVYLDIKSAMRFPLDKILYPDDEYILAHWSGNPQHDKVNNTMGEYQQWHIICKPGHPFLKKVIQTVIKNIQDYRLSDGTGKETVLKVTGPIAYTNAIIPLLDKYNHRLVEIDEMAGLVYNNLDQSHIKLFSKTHYSKISEPIILF